MGQTISEANYLILNSMKKILLFVFLLVTIIGRGQTLIASYSESNYTTNAYFGTYKMFGETFYNTVQDTLISCKFYINRLGGGTVGSVKASIYATTGTFGTTMIPTGSSLATTDDLAAMSITGTLTLVNFNFTGVNKIILSPGTYYAIVYDGTGYVSGGALNVGLMSPTGTYAGNSVRYNGTTWTSNTQDLIFYVYANPSSAADIQKQSLFFLITHNYTLRHSLAYS